MELLVAEDCPATRWGLPRHVLDVSRELVRRGHILDLVYRESGDLVPAYKEFCRSVRRVPALRLQRRRPFSSGVGLILARRIACRPRHDVVYLHHAGHDAFGCLASLGGHALPVVCHLRYAPPQRFGASSIVALPLVSRFIAVSDHTKRTWVAAGLDPGRIGVVHGGVDTDHYAPSDPDEVRNARAQLGIGPEDTLVAYAGRIHPSKGLDVLAAAVSSIARPDVRLVIAGAVDPRPNPVAAEAYAESVRRSSPPGTRFTGLLSDVAPLYRAADVVVVPSVGDEALARVVLEAMSCGVPVIASRRGGIPEVLTGEFDRFLFEPGDAEALANRILVLRGWRQRQPRLGQACRAHAEHRFSLARAVNGIEDNFRLATEQFRTRGGSGTRGGLLRWGRSRHGRASVSLAADQTRFTERI